LWGACTSRKKNVSVGTGALSKQDSSVGKGMKNSSAADRREGVVPQGDMRKPGKLLKRKEKEGTRRGVLVLKDVDLAENAEKKREHFAREGAARETFEGDSRVVK